MTLKDYILNNKVEDLFNNINSENIKTISSYELFILITIADTNKQYQNILLEFINPILNQICLNFNLYDCLSLLTLIKNDLFKEKAKEIYNRSVKMVFSTETLLFLNNLNRKISKADYSEESLIYNILFTELNKMNNNRISKILYNLFLLLDFRKVLKLRYSTVELMIDKYQKFDPNTLSDNLFTGSSIIGCLMKGENQYIAKEYFDLLKKEAGSNSPIKMIGGGSTSLVYKIGNNVLKLGETRNCRKVCIDFRILASRIRKLIIENGKELFYVEIMKYVKTGDITKEECEELRKDLLQRGIVWEDAKPENCGLLNNNDQNECNLNFEDILVETDASQSREQFMKRKRKVVVLDNDNMKALPIAFWNQKKRN